jgi:hypothetical protein
LAGKLIAGGRRYLVRIVALVLLLSVWWVTRLPHADAAETRAAAGDLAFQASELVPIDIDGYKSQRTVEPALEKLRTWISGVGASIAFADLQGAGRARDLCYVDPRTDTVSVQPVPGTPAGYPAFAVDPAPLRYDRATMAPTGCLPGDFNEDGWTDLLLFYWGRSPAILLRHPSAPLSATAFTPVELVQPIQRWYTDAVATADVDGDGHPDVIVGNYFPDGSRLLDASATRDPALQMNSSMSRAFNGGADHIFLWSGATAAGVSYRDTPGALRPVVSHAWTLAIGAQDLTGDGLPELYFANDFGPDRLLVNESTPGTVRLREIDGSGGFATPKSKVLGHDSFKGMGIDFGDLNADGRTDMFVSNISAQHGLMETNFAWLNTGKPVAAGKPAPFQDASDRLGVARTGWGWDAKIDDFANDGTPDIVQATGFVYGADNLWPQVSELAMANDGLLSDPRAWMQQTAGWGLEAKNQPVMLAADGERYLDVSDKLGLNHQGITRSVAIGDPDGDGRLDMALAGQWGPSVYYHNVGAGTRTSLELRLLRPTGVSGGVSGGDTGYRVATGAAGDALRGVPAIGARATVTLPGGRTYTAQVDGGNGHAGVRVPVLHFGLGDLAAGQTVHVAVDWRATDGTQHRRALDIAPGRWSVILE